MGQPSCYRHYIRDSLLARQLLTISQRAFGRVLLQEEDEQSYKQHFPDHFSAFADVAELDAMPNLGDDSAVATTAAATEADSGLSEAEASSSAAQQLLHGAILADVVTLHARCVAVERMCPSCLHCYTSWEGWGGVWQCTCPVHLFNASGLLDRIAFVLLACMASSASCKARRLSLDQTEVVCQLPR